MKKTPIYHPFLFAIVPILFIYIINIDQVAISFIFPPLAISLSATLLLWFVLKLFINDGIKRGIILSTIVILFFSYGHLHELLLNWLIRVKGLYGNDAQKIYLQLYSSLNFQLLLAYFLTAIASIIYIIKTRRSLFDFTKFLNSLAVILFIFYFSNILFHNFSKPSFLLPANQKEEKVEIRDLSKSPDIYYIILDGYGREDILRGFYDFDNSEFIGFLKKNGFFVASKSRCNYNWTYLSLSSSLNYEYINYLSDIVGIKSRDRKIAYSMIRNNKVVSFLKSRGYRFIHFNSTWGATASNSFADIEISNKKGVFHNDFYRVLVSTSLLRVLDSHIKSDLARWYLFNFRMLEKVPTFKGPKFVFIHILQPHHPYLFDREGNIKRTAYVFDQFEFQKHLWRRKDLYIDQLMFVNKTVEKIVGAILQKSKIPPIIILQSDHGPTLEDVDENVFLKARLANFNAYYFPGGKDSLYETITPVNTFRIIFNNYFGQDYILLPDESYYSTYKQPYNFRKIE